jgi:hypothetical protein
MTDRDLEARLSQHLHRRYDAIGPSPELLGAVDQVLSTRPRPIGLAAHRAGRREIGWTGVLAAGLIAAVAVAAWGIGGSLPPGAKPTPTPGPTVVASDERFFVVLPPTGDRPSKAETTLAEVVLTKRLQALGFGTFSMGGGDAIQYQLPQDGPSDKTVEDTLRATGDVRFVPLPPAQYGTAEGPGPLEARVGEPLPTDEPALFGWEGIASVTAGENQQALGVVNYSLKPAAAQAFGDYTAAHVGEFFAILIDGWVASVPSINEPISGGEVQLSIGGLNGEPSAAMAILVGGKLPDGWADPIVPEILQRAAVTDKVLRELTAAGAGAGQLAVESADLEARLDGKAWRAVWRVTVDGDFGPVCFGGILRPSGGAGCSELTSLVIIVDATTGERVAGS